MVTEIKGIAIAGIVNRIKEKYGLAKYQEIVDALNPTDQNFFNHTVLASFWYPMDSFVNFLEAEVALIFNGDITKLSIGSEGVISK